jgi:drug/metabolite transporter (DMT)-like permease
LMKPALAVLYLAVFGSCIAYTAYVYLAKAWSPGKMGTYAYLNPIVAVLLGLIIREAINERIVIGMIVVLIGVALVQLRPKAESREKDPQEDAKTLRV